MTNRADIDDDLAALLIRAIHCELAQLHTGLPAKVVSFDAAKQTADVQPLLQRVILDENEEPMVISLPEIPSRPVIFPSFGPWSITSSLLPDEIVFLTVIERSIDDWLEAPPGTLVEPRSARRHDLSDVVVLPGFRPRTNPIAGINQ